MFCSQDIVPSIEMQSTNTDSVTEQDMSIMIALSATPSSFPACEAEKKDYIKKRKFMLLLKVEKCSDQSVCTTSLHNM